ncbi:MAG: hypothetical protein NVSMB18_16480 [Acetobacteraceae bacterium]
MLADCNSGGHSNRSFNLVFQLGVGVLGIDAAAFYGLHTQNASIANLNKTRPDILPFVRTDINGYCVNTPADHYNFVAHRRYARNLARTILETMPVGDGGTGGKRGPYITGATRSGRTITLTFVHDGGTTLRGYAADQDRSSDAATTGETERAATPQEILSSSRFTPPTSPGTTARTWWRSTPPPERRSITPLTRSASTSPHP